MWLTHTLSEISMTLTLTDNVNQFKRRNTTHSGISPGIFFRKCLSTCDRPRLTLCDVCTSARGMYVVGVHMYEVCVSVVRALRV